MTITIDWLTKVINVNKVDMILIQSMPTTIYQLDLDVFRKRLNDIQDDPEGIPQLTTHNHNTTVTVGGAILARVVEIINGYTVTFEDGQYAVNLVGANSNVGDVVNVNQVSVRSSNSAGLQDLNSLQAASFNGAVALDIASPFTGTVFPVGTRAFPASIAADALAIATARGLTQIQIMTSMTLSTEDFSVGYQFYGDSPVTVTLTLEPGTDITNCEFRNLTVTGTLDGANTFRECHLVNCTMFNGSIHESSLVGTLTLGGGALAQVYDCWSGITGGDPGETPTVDMGGSGQDMILRNFSGGITITNCSSTDTSLDMGSGRIILAPTVTGGTFTVRGIATLDDQSTGTTINNGLVDATALMAAHKILRNKTITDPITGIMTVYDDDGVTVLLTADIFQDAAGVTAYVGQGIERRERLT